MSTEKPDLFSGWSWPKAIPEDLYKNTFGGSDYQWIIMSQPKTGTHVHQDPDLTDAWNALLYGHKVKTISKISSMTLSTILLSITQFFQNEIANVIISTLKLHL